MSTYILLKDLPDAKAGTEYKLDTHDNPKLPESEKTYFYYAQYEEDRMKFPNGTSRLKSMRMPRFLVEHNTDWLIKKEENLGYILQKDLPNIKSGAHFVVGKSENGVKQYFAFADSGTGEGVIYYPECVENNPEWFLPKSDGIYGSHTNANFFKDINADKYDVRWLPIGKDGQLLPNLKEVYHSYIKSDGEGNSERITVCTDWQLTVGGITLSIPKEIPKEMIGKITVIHPKI